MNRMPMRTMHDYASESALLDDAVVVVVAVVVVDVVAIVVVDVAGVGTEIGTPP